MTIDCNAFILCKLKLHRERLCLILPELNFFFFYHPQHLPPVIWCDFVHRKIMINGVSQSSNVNSVGPLLTEMFSLSIH